MLLINFSECGTSFKHVMVKRARYEETEGKAEHSRTYLTQLQISLRLVSRIQPLQILSQHQTYRNITKILTNKLRNSSFVCVCVLGARAGCVVLKRDAYRSITLRSFNSFHKRVSKLDTTASLTVPYFRS